MLLMRLYREQHDPQQPNIAWTQNMSLDQYSIIFRPIIKYRVQCYSGGPEKKYDWLSVLLSSHEITCAKATTATANKIFDIMNWTGY